MIAIQLRCTSKSVEWYAGMKRSLSMLATTKRYAFDMAPALYWYSCMFNVASHSVSVGTGTLGSMAVLVRKGLGEPCGTSVCLLQRASRPESLAS